MVRHRVEWHALGLADPAPPDFVAINIEEGDRVVALITLIDLGCLDRRKGQGEEKRGSHSSKGESVSDELCKQAKKATWSQPAKPAIDA